MSLTQGNIAVGVFHEPAQARQALQELRQAGYSDEEIGYLARATATEPDATTATSIATSAAEGGIAGGLLGAAVALLIPGFGLAIAGGILVATLSGAALGAAAGGIIDALRSLDIPEEEARHYQKELEAGHIVITVKAQSGYADALQILQRNGAHDVATRYSEINANPPIRTFGSAEPDDSASAPPRTPEQ
jgi:thymidine phosphorylase